MVQVRITVRWCSASLLAGKNSWIFCKPISGYEYYKMVWVKIDVRWCFASLLEGKNSWYGMAWVRINGLHPKDGAVGAFWQVRIVGFFAGKNIIRCYG